MRVDVFLQDPGFVFLGRGAFTGLSRLIGLKQMHHTLNCFHTTRFNNVWLQINTKKHDSTAERCVLRHLYLGQPLDISPSEPTTFRLVLGHMRVDLFVDDLKS